ncbi:unnamed protein product [Trichobilharzia szidati]|nr:unnamed protein product [Trichobilharzia szidati]
MDEQETFQVNTVDTIATTVIDNNNNNTATATATTIISSTTNSNSNSPHSSSKNEVPYNFTDQHKSYEHELSNSIDDEHYHRHIQDMMIDQTDANDIAEDIDDQEYPDDINPYSHKMDTFNFTYSTNTNDSDDSMKQITNMNRDTEKTIYSKSALNNPNDDKRPRKFVCRYCNKAFSLMNVLKVHERIHTGEKPYVCEICNKAFNQSGSLNRHKNTHTKRSSDNRSYSCRFCPRQFLHSSQLQDHETVEHSMEANVPNSKSNDSGVRNYTTPPPTSLSTIAPTMTDETNIIKQNHLSSQLLHNKVINDSLKLSGVETSSMDQNASNVHANNLDNEGLDDANSVAYLNSAPNLFELDTKSIGASNKFPFPYGLNLISKFLPVGTADDFMRSIEENNINGALNCLVTTATANSTSPSVVATATSFSNGVDPVSHGTVKQDFLNNTNTFTCTLCSANLSSKTELDLHWGQHFIQQMEAQLGPISNNLIPSSTISPLPNPLGGLQISTNSSSPLSNLASNLSLPFVNTHNSLKLNDQTEKNKMLPETSDAFNFDNRLPNASLSSNLPLLDSNSINSGAAAAAAAAASAAIVAALSQFLLVNTPGQSLPNPSLLAATAALTNPDLLNTLINTMPANSNNNNSNNTASQGNMNEFNLHHFTKLLNSLTSVNNSNFPHAITHSNDISQRLFNMDTTPTGLKEHALNFTIDKTSNISPDSLNKSPTSSSSSSLVSSTTSTSGTTITTSTLPTPISHNYPFSNHLNQKTLWPCNLEVDFTNRSLVNPLQPNRSLNQLFTEIDTNLSMNTSSSSTNSHDLQDKLKSTFNLSAYQNNLSSSNCLISGINETSLKSINSRLLGIENENYSSDVEGGGGIGGTGFGGGGGGGGNLTDSTLSGSFNSSKRKRSSSPNTTTPNSKARKCSFCNKQFNCTSALRIHYRKHSGERPYICRHCGKAFSQNGTLKRHSQTCKAAYNNINTSNSDINNNNNKECPLGLKMPLSNDNSNSLIMNTPNHITDPVNLKPSNFPLLCDPIDELSDSEGQMNTSQIENTTPTIHNNTEISHQYAYPEANEKQLNNIETSRLWKNNKNMKDEQAEEEDDDESACLNNSLTSPIISNDVKRRKYDSTRFYATMQGSNFSNQINHFKQEQQENGNLDSTLTCRSQLTHWSDLDLTNLSNNDVKQLLVRLHSMGKLHGCIDCQTFYLDENMANYHLNNMHVNKHSDTKTFECLNCGEDLTNPLLFLKHFTHCLSTKKFNGVDLSVSSSLPSENLSKETDESETKVLLENVNESSGLLENNKLEKTLENCTHETTEVLNSPHEEIITTSLNDNNDSNDNRSNENYSLIININDESETKINGHCSEEVEEHTVNECSPLDMPSPGSVGQILQ